MAKALDGVNLVEFSSHLGAAYAAMMLAEQGADAVRVEPPGGAPGRGTPHFHVLNRSKRPVFADPDSKEGAAAIRALLRWADIVITGYTPGRSRALELDYDSICKLNPRAILVSMPPFGSRGEQAELDADDLLVQARGGIAGSQWARSGNPVALTFPAASYSAGAMAAIAATAALVARAERGPGQSVEVSLLAGAFSLQTGSIIYHPQLIALYALASGDPLGPIPCYRLFEARDGDYLFVACGNATFWNKFAIALERPELVADPRFEGAPWGSPPDHWQTLKDILAPIMRTRSRDEWLAILREDDVPCAPVLSRYDFIDDGQVRCLEMRREVHDPILGPTIQMGVPVNLSEMPGDIVGPAPAVHETSAARILSREAAPERCQPTPIAAVGRGPLDGVLVLDFASYIAGSYGPMILAQLGADVIKIESREGDAFRNFGFGFLGWNLGKRGLALDLNTAKGREIVHELAKKADIVVENLRPGRMRRFGLDYETIARNNPRLIYMSLNGFGNRGPEHDQPGFDPLLQARSGAMAAQGGHHGHPVYLTCAICDYGAAMLSALGCVLAIHARRLTGRGQFCETSLLQAALAFQAGEFVFYPQRPDMEDGSAEYRGPSALRRCYQCSGGDWLAISIATAAHWDAMRRMAGAAPDLSYAGAAREPSEGRLADTLGKFFAKLERADALRMLSEAGVPATPVNRIRELFSDPQIAANELLAEVVHSTWGPVTQTGLLAKFSATVPSVTRAAPLLGEHTAEILSQYLGYGADEIAELKSRGVVR